MNASEVVYTISPSNDSTVALELAKTGLMKNKKHLLFFEQFEGELRYIPQAPEASKTTFSITAGSLVCRDKWLKPRKIRKVTSYARQALNVSVFPSITFQSASISAKPLRGYAVEGTLTIRDVSRPARLNIVLTEMSRGALQIDGDATLKLTDFGIEPPKSLLGLIKTQNEVLVRLLLWGRVKAAGV